MRRRLSRRPPPALADREAAAQLTGVPDVPARPTRMFRPRTGSSLCYSWGKLNRVGSGDNISEHGPLAHPAA